MTEIVEDRITYEQIEETASYLSTKFNEVPKVAIICGTGMGYLGDITEKSVVIKYEEIPHFPQVSVEGHEGCLVFGYLESVPVVFMKGRFHYYEGFSLSTITMPCRVFKLMGCTYLIVSNASGSINAEYKIGDIMLIKDHLNFLGFPGFNPLRGPNEDRFGERFISMNAVYDKDTRKQAVKIARKLGIDRKLRQGVYANLGGPSYESVAEAKLLRIFGADAVGMSTVPEVIVAKHCGLQIFAFSIITEEGILDYAPRTPPNHLDVLAAAEAMEKPLQEFVKEMVKYIGSKKPCTCVGSK